MDFPKYRIRLQFTIPSSSSGMDDRSRHLTAASARTFNHGEGGAAEEDEDEEYCDAQAWETLSRSFREVQSVLDHNHTLIQQVNDNHNSRIPRNLAENASLIREINANISKVIGLYSNLSADLSGIVHQRRSMAGKALKNSES